jgi:hypothetical protein
MYQKVRAPNTRCKTAQERKERKRAANRRWKRKNTDRLLQYKRNFMAKNPRYLGPTRQAYVDRYNEIKATTPCKDCDTKYQACCMHFDHLGDKIDNVSRMVGQCKPWSEIEAEMKKCELVCANCHALRTWSRQQ